MRTCDSDEKISQIEFLHVLNRKDRQAGQAPKIQNRAVEKRDVGKVWRHHHRKHALDAYVIARQVLIASYKSNYEALMREGSATYW